MFKKYYKQANDDIKTNRELIDKIFEAADKPVKKKNIVKVYKFGIAVAAVAVLAISIGILPYFSDNGQGDTINLPIAVNDNAHNSNYKSNSDEKKGEITDSNIDAPIQNDGKAEQADSNVKKETNVPEITEPVNPEADVPEKIEPINPEPTDNPVTDEGVILAMEGGEQQPFVISERPGGRMIEPEQSGTNAENVLYIDGIEPVSEDENAVIQNMLLSNIGEVDEITGNRYGFVIVGKKDDIYFGRWNWWVDDHYSQISEFVLVNNMTEMYECLRGDDGWVSWTTENNLFY